MKKTISEVDPAALAGKTAVVRVDFNVPLEDRRVVDDRRIKESLPTIDLLRRAGRSGLGDAAIRRVATDLVEIAMAGCAHLGPGYFHPSDLEQARLFFDQYTRHGRAPADDLEGAEIAA